MGHKTHPVGFRLGVTKTWASRWYAPKGEYQRYVHEDMAIRKLVKSSLSHAGVAKIDIDRAAGNLTVNIFSARPGLVIGKKGAGIDSLRLDIQQLAKNDD